jgi:hypothetical protein
MIVAGKSILTLREANVQKTEARAAFSLKYPIFVPVPNHFTGYRKRVCKKRGNGESHCLFLFIGRNENGR